MVKTVRKFTKIQFFRFLPAAGTLCLSVLCAGMLYTPVISHAEEEAEPVPVYGTDIRDGSYEVEVESSSSMFRIIKANLHVAEGSMAADITLSGTGYLKLFMGTGKEALEAEEESFIPYVEDEEGAYTYTIPVEALNTEFACAAYSRKKETWYDRQLVVLASSLPEEALLIEVEEKKETADAETEEAAGAGTEGGADREAGKKPDETGKEAETGTKAEMGAEAETGAETETGAEAEKEVEPEAGTAAETEPAKVENPDLKPVAMQVADGDYTMEITLSGGSGKAAILSPAPVRIAGGTATASLTWSSPNYDYMIVNGIRYEPVNTEGNSVFEVPVLALDQEIAVIADTVAMSKPHEVAYTLTFRADTLQKAEGGNYTVIIAVLCLVVLCAAIVFFMFWKKRFRIFFLSGCLLCSVIFAMAGCGRTAEGQDGSTAGSVLESRDTDISSLLFYQESMELQYACRFAVDYYRDGYLLLSVADGRRYLVVPEDKEEPEDLAEDIMVLKRPVGNLYLVASAAMDMFRELDALDTIRFSGQKADGWYIPEARKEMEQGNILYAGKYNAPDYEQIVSEGCSLAIENDMISHAPEVIEKLEDFGIPVFIDYSSYENHPLGRVEWIKLYGALLGKEEAAKAAFEKQTERMKYAAAGEASGKTVAFFYITANGMVSVRVSSDYVPKMIELAGGKYIFENLGDAESSRSSMTMQMEEFYHTAKDADYLIYNSTIDGELESVDELLEKEGLLGDFKAVQEGNVWCTTKDLYQQSMSIGQMIEDIHRVLSGDEEEQKEVLYLYSLEETGDG